MSNITEKLKKGQNLSFEDSKVLFSELMEGKYDENTIIEIINFVLGNSTLQIDKKFKFFS